jgi:pimeloyl-ACP methyl ester carboxylesterase
MITSHFIQANGLRIHYIRHAANKPQLLLLHGLTDAAICWTPVIEALAGEYGIVAPDARGHGESGAPERGYSPADHAGDVAAFIRALDLNKPVVMGHSMGGMVATVVAAQHPELIRAAIFEDPAWFDESQQPTAEVRKLRADEWRQGLIADQALAPAEMIAQRRAAARSGPRLVRCGVPTLVGGKATGALASAGIHRARADGLASAGAGVSEAGAADHWRRVARGDHLTGAGA